MVASDPYGTDLLLSNDGDFAVTPAGQLATITGPMNCAQALVSCLRTHRGELPLQPDYGNALTSTVIGTKANDPSLVVSRVNAELRLVLQRDRRFLKAERIVARSDATNPTRSEVYVELVLAGGDRLVANGLAGSPSLSAFTSQPELAEVLDPDELTAALGPNPDEGDDLPEFADALEGFNDFEIREGPNV